MRYVGALIHEMDSGIERGVAGSIYCYAINRLLAAVLKALHYKITLKLLHIE